MVLNISKLHTLDTYLTRDILLHG